MGIFAIFMPPGNFHSHEDLMRMNLFDGALFSTPIYTYAIANLQHCSVPSGKKSILVSGGRQTWFLLPIPSETFDGDPTPVRLLSNAVEFGKCIVRQAQRGGGHVLTAERPKLTERTFFRYFAESEKHSSPTMAR